MFAQDHIVMHTSHKITESFISLVPYSGINVLHYMCYLTKTVCLYTFQTTSSLKHLHALTSHPPSQLKGLPSFSS